MTEQNAEILLVEDDPNDVELAMLALNKQNLMAKVQVARDGEEALDFLFCRGPHANRSFKTPPRLILLDLKLPKVTGMEVLREVKGDKRTRPIPITVMTSSRQRQEILECYQLGANSFIQKPIDFDQFQKLIHELGYYWLAVNQALPNEH